MAASSPAFRNPPRRTRRDCFRAAAALTLAAAWPWAVRAQPRALPTDGAGSEWRGDFDGMLERRLIRVAVPFSRSLYYSDKGRERGITADFVRDFERFVNDKYRKTLGKRPLTVVIRPTTRDRLLPYVVDGRADIAAGNLTVTEARLQVVDFVGSEKQPPAVELVVTGHKVPPVAAAADLSGRSVHVRPSSSYHDSLRRLNAELEQAGRAPVRLVLVPDALEDEDMMEMVATGMLEAIVVDGWKAQMWAPVLPALHLNPGAVLREGGRTGWAIRKDSPQLAALLHEFDRTVIVRQNLYAVRIRDYQSRARRLRDATAASEAQRFEQTRALFETYGARYRFDPLMLAAQGYQESQLNQQARSPVGAVGLMQLMPATGAEMKVGDILVAEANVHAGAKYMDQLMTRYLADASFDETNRTLFAFAAYNAGPGNISRMRKEAARRGLDPNQWFNHVEVVTAEKIGIETTTYVRNIYKYYVAYRLTQEARAEQDKARATLKPPG